MLKTLGVQLRASMPLYERSVGFASLRNSGRSTSGVHARPLSKVRCCRPKKFGRLPKGLPPVAPNTAIPTTLLKAHHAFRHTNPPKTALSLENCQHTCHMNALFVLRPAKLRAFNFGHPCPFMNALLVSHHIASSAISAVASYNGFVWLTLSIHA